MILITTICVCRAGVRGATSTLTFKLCRSNSNVAPQKMFMHEHDEDSSGSRLQHLQTAQLARVNVLPRVA